MGLSLHDNSFWAVLLRSETFWSGAVLWGACAIGLTLALIVFTARRYRARPGERVGFWSNRSGAVAPLEFLLLTPVYLFLVSIIVQFLLFAQSSLVVHQAAYAAARSARVHACVPLSLNPNPDALIGQLVGFVQGACADDPDRWINAARLSLIAAAPSSTAARERAGPCDFPEGIIEMVVGGGSAPVRGSLEDAVREKACYVFEEGNVEVFVEWQTNLLTTLATSGPPPMRAQVNFRHQIVTPSGMLLADGRRSDRTRFRVERAVVTLL